MVFLLINTWLVGKDLMKHCVIKEVFHSSLNMEGIADVDYRYATKVLKYFSNKSLDDCHDLFV